MLFLLSILKNRAAKVNIATIANYYPTIPNGKIASERYFW